MESSLEKEVRSRADGRCEYCHFPERLSELRHVIDHIIARQHKGATAAENLCLCCGRCNLHKGPNIAGIDPVSKELHRLFNPRVDAWGDHFTWMAAVLVGVTPIGRATIEVLQINEGRRLTTRNYLIDMKRWSPD